MKVIEASLPTALIGAMTALISARFAISRAAG